jgi:hypothetical protein
MSKKIKEETQIQEPQLDNELKKELDESEKTDYSSLVSQVQTEYKLSWFFMKPKYDEWALRLKLYNNQKRDKTAIGDPLLFTIHQTVLASLYNDRLAVEFLGREAGDEETAENLNAMADYDYDEMEKNVIDYDWDWDASFFGCGLLLNMEFSRDLKCPTPEVIDPMTWLRDPRAVSVNGDIRGRGAMRFGGREIRLTKEQMKKSNGLYFDYENLKEDTGNDIYSLLDQNSQARDDAQGRGDVSKFENLAGENGQVRLLEWFTYWKGKRCLVTLADKMTKVVRYTDLSTPYFPIIDRRIYPIAHDWDGVSIPDLVEDKQRGRAVVENAAFTSIKLGVQPRYLFDTNKIKNRANLNIDFNKHIPVNGNPNDAIIPVQNQVIKQEVQWILDVLDTAAQKATATPDIQQGATSQDKRTATELNLQTQKVDTRYSLSAKIFGWSEKKFWSQWYGLYKDHFAKDIDEKVVRVVGALGAKWRTLTRENIIAETDPDIKIESKVVAETQQFNELQKYRLFVKDIMATDPQNANVRFALRKIGRLSGFRKDDIEQVLPPTVDEMKAEQENYDLDKGRLVDVQVFDDDFVHFEIHNKAADTPEKFAHINAHKRAMMIKRLKPELDLAKGNRQENPVDTVGNPVQFMNGGGGVPNNPPVNPIQ